MFVGVSIGVLLGLCLALAVALYLNKANPFVAQPKAPEPKAAERSEPPKAPVAGMPGGGAQAPRPKESAASDSSRFDFYRILPGEERQVPRTQPEAPVREVFYLQAGAFQSAADADNLKARLALAGLEAQIQTATLADRSVWHRVRLGPYPDSASMNQARTLLRENRIEPSIIKLAESQPSS
jgi:cell division protein FtsN